MAPPASPAVISRRHRVVPLALAVLLAAPAAFAAAPTLEPASPTAESEHFAVSCADGRDELLAPYLIEALEGERARLVASGVAVPGGKLAVEVHPAPGDLVKRSSLTPKDVAAGVSAVCENGLVLLVSPRAARGGYPWIDAALGEYRRCVESDPPRGRPASFELTWRTAPRPKQVSGAEAELVRDYARLGDILRARGRLVPARIEYDKAVRRGGLSDPDVVARYAETALATGGIGAAEEPLRAAAREHPRHAGVQAALGKLASEEGAWPAARDAFAASIRVDPFDPEVHAGLAAALEALGDATGASREKRVTEMLRR